MSRKKELKKLSVVAMLCAVAYLCMFLFKFKISFLTFDFKDAFLAIISFLYGPVYSVASAVIVAFFEFLSVSDTGIYGFLMNAISSAAFAGACGLLYKYKLRLKNNARGACLDVGALPDGLFPIYKANCRRNVLVISAENPRPPRSHPCDLLAVFAVIYRRYMRLRRPDVYGKPDKEIFEHSEAPARYAPRKEEVYSDFPKNDYVTRRL